MYFAASLQDGSTSSTGIEQALSEKKSEGNNSVGRQRSFPSDERLKEHGSLRCPSNVPVLMRAPSLVVTTRALMREPP